MPLDPYHEKMTIWGKIKKALIAIWPTIYNLVNWLVNTIVKNIVEMVKFAIRSLKP